MPNWVYNNLFINGPQEDIVKVKNQLNSPFVRQHERWNIETNISETIDVSFSNPIFSFWNIIAPTDLTAYNLIANSDNHSNPNNWYSWNIRNWGTKWDVAVSDIEEYAETELVSELDNSLSYRFNTAWCYPEEAIMKLVEQYPALNFELEFEEETGWGGRIGYQMGAFGLERNVYEEYDSKCDECDSLDKLDWCEDCENTVCSFCGYGTAEEGCTQHMVEANV
jgi:hypothetical protein